MKLLLHIGTEKTGSSFLQYLCGQNRDFLAKNGIYFPEAGRDERRLLKGDISPGNARELAELMNEGNWSAVYRWLRVRVRAGSSNGCESVLLSHELLYVALARDETVDQFKMAANQAGVKKFNALLMIRDPVDQAVSLFKHRAKNGVIGEIDEWLQTSYELPGEISNFIDHVGGGRIPVILRKYTRDSDMITRVFFGDWLKLSDPPKSFGRIVNPSLTFSELRLIRHLALARPDCVPVFFQNLVALPRDQKASEIALERSVRGLVENHLSRFNNLWDKLDVILANEGGIDVPASPTVSAAPSSSYTFSDAQLSALAETISEAFTVKNRVKVLIDRVLRRPVGKMLAKVKAAFMGKWR